MNSNDLEQGWSRFNELSKAYSSITNEDLNNAVEKLLDRYKEPLEKISNEMLKDILFYGEADIKKYVEQFEKEIE